MTTILTFACPVGILQVGDRLVSAEVPKPDPITQQPFTRTPYDKLANKALVYCAKNALVSIAYGGPAYLENVPTDEWIAEKLWGEKLPRFIDGSPCKQIGRDSTSWPDIGYAVRRLKSALESLAPSIHDLTLLFAGWQKVKCSARPIMIQLDRKCRTTRVELADSPRWWPKSQNVRMHEIGGYFTQHAANILSQRLKSAARGDFDAYETIIADAIREISSANVNSVGSNLFSILLPFYRLGIPRVRFLPVEEHKISVIGPRVREILTVYYTPWLIGPAMIYPPSYEIGDSIVNLGRNFNVYIQGAPANGRFKGLSGGYKRQPLIMR